MKTPDQNHSDTRQAREAETQRWFLLGCLYLVLYLLLLKNDSTLPSECVHTTYFPEEINSHAQARTILPPQYEDNILYGLLDQSKL